MAASFDSSPAMRSLAQLSDFASLFTQSARILTLRFGSGSGIDGNALLPHRLKGEEALSECYRFDLECLSPDAHLELKDVLGLPVEIGLLLADGGCRVLSGLVTEAKQLGSDGGFAKYGLAIEPALAVLRHRANCRVFQDQSVPEIVAAILDEHIGANAVFAMSFQHRSELTKDYPPRSYCLQYRESDLAFIERLLREEGISYRFAFGDAADTRDTDTRQQDVPTHTLVLFDDAFSLNQAAQGKVRFHRADGTEGEDSIKQWEAARQIQSGLSSLASFDYKRVSLLAGAEQMASAQGESGNSLASTLEHYDPQTAYYGSNTDDVSRYAALRQQGRDLKTKSFSGRGTARALSVGHWFELANHPVHDQDTPEDRQFLVTRLSFEAENNLPKEAASAFTPSPLAGANRGERDATVYRNSFQAVRRGIPVVPEFASGHAKPKSLGPQTATVVGPADEEIYTDKMGRVKIQFHWQRQQDGYSNLNETSSTWVRVAYPSAGANWGHQHIPRIGQEVLVNFIENDIDRPIITGVIHNGTHNPPTFSGAGSLPANKTLSGIKTKEYKGSHYNELLFDDSTGETRAKLSSEHGKTQLNQGYLIHPRMEGKGEPRGEGFELRTDHAGAVRAAKGLIVSADARPNATGRQLDRQEALAQLSAALELANDLSDTAEHQLANKTETGKDNQLIDGDRQAGRSAKSGHQQHLRDVVESLERGSNTDKDAKGGNKDQAGGQGVILMSAPAGIALATPNSMTISTGGNFDQVSQRDTNQTTGRRWVHNVGESISLFVSGVAAGTSGKIKETLKLIAAKGKVQIQAQSGEMELTADKDLKLASVTQDITAAAKDGIVATSGGGYARIKGGNIDIHCPGTLEIRAANIVLSGPDGMNMPPLVLPQPLEKMAYSQRLDWEGIPETWVPMPETHQTAVQKESAPLTVLMRGPEQPETRAVLSNAADKVRYLGNLQAGWEVEEFIDLPAAGTWDELDTGDEYD